MDGLMFSLVIYLVGNVISNELIFDYERYS